MSQDKLNRLYGTDYLNEYKRLDNQVNKRLKDLGKRFPNMLTVPDKDIAFELRLEVLCYIEEKIKNKYNNHEQGTLFNV